MPDRGSRRDHEGRRFYLRTDLRTASSVLTIAARGLSRELATGTHAACFAPITDQHAPNRTVREGPDRRPFPALGAGTNERAAVP